MVCSHDGFGPRKIKIILGLLEPGQGEKQFYIVYSYGELGCNGIGFFKTIQFTGYLFGNVRRQVGTGSSGFQVGKLAGVERLT